MDTDHLFRLGFKSVLRSGFRGLIVGLLLFFASVAQPGATPLFMTHHSPVGAWASLTFGLPGGGFGGCAVALVKADAVDRISKTIAADYKARTGNDATIFSSRPSAGAIIIQA